MATKQCSWCKSKFDAVGNKRYCSEACLKKRTADKQKRVRMTSRYKDWNAKYRSTSAYAAQQDAYNHSPEGKQRNAKYRSSIAGRAAARRHKKSRVLLEAKACSKCGKLTMGSRCKHCKGV